MLEMIKVALRIKADAFDGELMLLIEAAMSDLRIAGVCNVDLNDPIIQRAVITYCKANFGDPTDYSRLKASYDEQKAQLATATGYTNWGRCNGQI